MVSVSISTERIDGWSFGSLPDPQVGTELAFTGLVRDAEKGEKIKALVYEQYEGMAWKELEKIGRETVEAFGINDLYCVHRVGTIPGGEAAIIVLIRSKHRQEAFTAMSWFMDELKKSVPIWKVRSVK